MTDPDDIDVPLLDALAKRDLVFVRTQERHSVVVEHEGRKVMVACTDRQRLVDWWIDAMGAEAGPPSVAELPFRQLVGLWASSDVDLLVDPGPGGGVVVPVEAARRHLGIGPVVPDGDGHEPLPFTGFTGGRTGVRVPLMLIGSCVLLLFLAVANGSVWIGLIALLGFGAAIALGHRSFEEIRQARRATQRLSQAQRLAKGPKGQTP